MGAIVLLLWACANWRAPELCDDLAGAICAGCSESLSEDECLAELDAQMPCEDAVDVSADYDECLTALDSSTCLLFDELPASCQGAIRVR
jgi:hypothetical protein